MVLALLYFSINQRKNLFMHSFAISRIYFCKMRSFYKSLLFLFSAVCRFYHVSMNRSAPLLKTAFEWTRVDFAGEAAIPYGLRFIYQFSRFQQSPANRVGAAVASGPSPSAPPPCGRPRGTPDLHLSRRWPFWLSGRRTSRWMIYLSFSITLLVK